MQYQSGAVGPVESIQNGWNIIKDDYWTFFGMTLVAVILIIIASVVLGLINNGITFGISAAMGVATSNAHDAAKVSAAIVPQLISMIISLFTNIIVGGLSGAFFCGIYKTLARKVSSGTADFGDLFAGFQKFVPCLIVAAVLSLIQFILSLIVLLGGAALGISALGMGMFKGGQIDPSAFGGLMLVFVAIGIGFLIINLIISALTTFSYPLIADRNLPGFDALMTSIKAGFSNLGGLILMMILLILISLGGALACLIGVLFVLPIFPATVFAAYQSVFGRNEGVYQSEPPPPPIFNQGY